MSMIDDLQKILKEELTENQLKLVEKDEKSRMEISISGRPNKCLFVTLPAKGQHLDCFVKDDTGYKHACDFFVIAEQNKEIDIYLVEAKKTIPDRKTNNPQLKKACEQIICALPTLEYLLTMVKVHCSQDRKVNRYFVVIGERTEAKLAKQRMKPSHFVYKKKFKVIYGKIIKFKNLKSLIAHSPYPTPRLNTPRLK